MTSFFGSVGSDGTGTLATEYDEGAIAMRRLLAVAQQDKLTGLAMLGIPGSGPSSRINSRKNSVETNVSVAALFSQVYAVDDQVDGLVTLSSGVQRWFPARIKALNNSTGTPDKYTYTLEYRDGDVQENKKADEVRRSKSRNKGGNSVVSAPIALPPVAAEILAVFAVDDQVDGFVTLKSGVQRWFPARIKALNNSTGTPDKYTYTLEYRDGDVQENKKADEVRRSKSRNKGGSSSGAGGSITSNAGAISTPVIFAALSPVAVEIFAVDDQVDGLVTLGSGTQRWFPARIKALNNSTGNPDKYTYTLEYRDGDVQENKGVELIRRTKSRGRVTIISSSSSSSSSSSAAAAGMESEMASNPTAVVSLSPLMNWRPQPITPPAIAPPSSSLTESTLVLSSDGSSGGGGGSGTDPDNAAAQGTDSTNNKSSLSVKIDETDSIPTRSPRGALLSILTAPTTSPSNRINPLLSSSGSDPGGPNSDNFSPSPRPGSAGSCDSAGSYGSDGDEIFTIPSVFEKARVEAKVSLVSKMNLKNLPISSAANEGGAFSLSMSLTMEVPENNADILRALDGFDEDEDEDLGDADDRSVVNDLFNELQSPLPMEEEEEYNEGIQEALSGSSEVPSSPLSLAFSLSPSPSPFGKRPSTPPTSSKNRPSTPPMSSGKSSVAQGSPISPFTKRPSTPPMGNAKAPTSIREAPAGSSSPFSVPLSGKRPISPPIPHNSGKTASSSFSINSGKSGGGGGSGNRPPLSVHSSLFNVPTGQVCSFDTLNTLSPSIVIFYVPSYHTPNHLSLSRPLNYSFY